MKRRNLQMNELKIVVNQKPGTITTNFEDIKEQLSAQMEIYNELEVTEDNKPERKKDVATLRKMQKAITAKKSEVRAACLAPYDKFSKQADVLNEIIQKPILLIDNQVKDFEEKQRLLKKQEIENYFTELIASYPELSDEIGIAEIYDNRWENISTTMKSVREDMAARLDKIQADVVLIKSMVSDKTEEALSLYWGDLDVTKAITMINHYEAQKREIQARLERQKQLEREQELERERERVREEERKRIHEVERIREEERKKLQEEQIAKEIAEKEKLSAKQTMGDTDMVTYKIIATAEEFEMIEMYLNSIGVEFIKGEF